MSVDDPVEAAIEHEIRFTHPVAAASENELTRRVYFVDERVVAFAPVGEAGQIVGLRIHTDRAVSTALLAAKFDAMLSAEIHSQLSPREVVRWRSKVSGVARPVFDELVRSGHAFATGPGQVAVGGPLIELMDRLDALLVATVATEGTVEYRYPTLIPTHALRRSGYLSSFPHHVMFATRLHADLVNYREFADEAEREHDDALAEAALRRCVSADHSLPPTMCYHTFHQLTGATLAGTSAAVTARGKSFRFEHRYHETLERLWDFTIREFVVLGPRHRVAERRDVMLRRACELFDRLGLAGHTELAHDPFFGGRQSGARVSSQRLLEGKYEARLSVAPDRTVAVGSFNLHERVFGEAFDIRLPDGVPPHSACAGFGLERLAYAVLCQHGVDQEGWPDALRQRPEGDAG